MKIYSILYAQDITHYARIDIEASSDGEAIKMAKDYPVTGDIGFDDPDWNNPVCFRIVNIEDGDGNTVIQDIPLDNYFLRACSDGERKIYDAATELLAACKTAAEDCRMALSGEWDKGDEGFAASLEVLESAIAKATGGAV